MAGLELMAGLEGECMPVPVEPVLAGLERHLPSGLIQCCVSGCHSSFEMRNTEYSRVPVVVQVRGDSYWAMR